VSVPNWKHLFLFTLAAAFTACLTPSTPSRQAMHPGPGSPAIQKATDGATDGNVDILDAPQRADPGYRILKEGRQKHENWLELNEYFLIHYLYNDIFLRFGLHKVFGLEDKIRILATVLFNLDFKTPVNLIIDDFNEEGSLVVSVQLMKFGRQRSVLLATNTDSKGSRLYVGMENVAKTYKRSYVIVEDQLIALRDLYSRRRESSIIEENRADRLAQFYIFDGNSSNDKVAEGLLIGSIRAAGTPLERGRSELMLSRYYISRNRLVEAQALLLVVGNQLVQSNGREAIRDSEELRDGYSIVYDELLITNALKKHAEQMREVRPDSL
jgi:hypothetical protein